MKRTIVAVAALAGILVPTAAHSAQPAMRVCKTPAAVHFAQCLPLRWGGNPPHPISR